MAEGDVVWTRDADLEQEDIWDDSALIDAYDRAVGEVKEAIAKKLNESENKKKQKPKVKPKSWKVGDFCKTVYSQDGLNYEAYIKEMSESGMNCLVQYIGYGNEEVVPISALQPSMGREAREQQELLSLKEIEWIEASVSMSDSTPMDFQQREKPKKKLHQSHRKSKRSSVTPEPNTFYSSMQPVFHSMPPHSPHPAAHWPGSFHYPNSAQRMPPIPPPPPFPVDHDMVKDDEALAAMLMSWYMSGYHTGFYQGMKQNQSHQNCQSCKCCPHSQR